MLRKIWNWILINLHLRKPETRKPKPPIDLLADLLPYICVVGVIIGAVKHLFPEGIPPLPWHRRLKNKLRRHYRKLRLAVIGW